MLNFAVAFMVKFESKMKFLKQISKKPIQFLNPKSRTCLKTGGIIVRESFKRIPYNKPESKTLRKLIISTIVVSVHDINDRGTNLLLAGIES